MRKHFMALRAMLDYLPFLAMLVPTLLLITAAAISLSPKAPAADMPSAGCSHASALTAAIASGTTS